MLLRTCAALLMTLALSVAVRADEPAGGELIRTRYKWQAGMTTYYRQTMTSDTTSGDGAAALSLRSKTAMLVRQEVYRVKDDGTGRVAMTFVRVRTENEGMRGEKRVFDSAEPDKSGDDFGGKAYGAMVGKTLIVEITPDGRTLRQEGMNEMFEASLKDPIFKDSPVRDSMKKRLDQMISGLTKSDALIPDPGHKVGEEWTTERSLSMPMLGDVKGKTVQKVVSVETVNGGRVATIGMTGSQEIKSGAADSAATTPSLPSRDMSMKMTGSTVFDLDRGRLIRSEMVVNSTSKIVMPDLQDGKAKERPMTGKVTMVTELVGPEEPLVPKEP